MHYESSTELLSLKVLNLINLLMNVDTTYVYEERINNYKKFYKECFNFSKFKYSRIGNPISFSTNGYSVCVNFELEKDINKEVGRYCNIHPSRIKLIEPDEEKVEQDYSAD
uniref:hypothetical protein n=1 Tax=Undibacterium luofuense TaxID=2828733 RepID=UPI0030ED6FA2